MHWTTWGLLNYVLRPSDRVEEGVTKQLIIRLRRSSSSSLGADLESGTTSFRIIDYLVRKREGYWRLSDYQRVVLCARLWWCEFTQWFDFWTWIEPWSPRVAVCPFWTTKDHCPIQPKQGKISNGTSTKTNANSSSHINDSSSFSTRTPTPAPISNRVSPFEVTNVLITSNVRSSHHVPPLSALNTPTTTTRLILLCTTHYAPPDCTPRARTTAAPSTSLPATSVVSVGAWKQEWMLVIVANGVANNCHGDHVMSTRAKRSRSLTQEAESK